MCMLVTSILGIGSATPAQAATWHKGTPKAIRGSWVCHKSISSGTPGWGQRKIYANKMTNQDQHMPKVLFTHLKYKSLGHGKYKIHCFSRIIKKSYGDKGGYMTLTFVKNNGKLKTGNWPWYHHGTV